MKYQQCYVKITNIHLSQSLGNTWDVVGYQGYSKHDDLSCGPERHLCPERGGVWITDPLFDEREVKMSHITHATCVKNQIVLASIHLADIWETPSSRARLHAPQYFDWRSRWGRVVLIAGTVWLQVQSLSGLSAPAVARGLALLHTHTGVCTDTDKSLYLYLCEDFYRQCIS